MKERDLFFNVLLSIIAIMFLVYVAAIFSFANEVRHKGLKSIASEIWNGDGK